MVFAHQNYSGYFEHDRCSSARVLSQSLAGLGSDLATARAGKAARLSDSDSEPGHQGMTSLSRRPWPGLRAAGKGSLRHPSASAQAAMICAKLCALWFIVMVISESSDLTSSRNFQRHSRMG